MATTDKAVVNLGLSRLGSQRVNNLTPPVKALEVHCAEGYPHWRDSELAIRTWNCSLRMHPILILTATLTNVERPYVFDVPSDMLRPIREKTDRWVMAGGKIYHTENTLTLESYVKRILPGEFDALFTDVLSWRVTRECVNAVTGGIIDEDKAERGYDKALAAAARANAFMREPRNIELHDDNDSWIQARHGMFYG